MTHIIYSQQQLQLKSIARLKQIYSEIACTVEVSDKRCKDAWITAIVEYQASKVQKLAPAAPDEQTTAQAELDNYIADQAQAVAPEPLTIVEISFSDYEYYAGNQLIASISHDDNHLTQRWVVMVNGKEVFRANTLMRCHRFICTHYKDGTLPVQEKETTPPTTENRIMAHIFNECENYGFEIIDDGIYTSDTEGGKLRKLGQVGCTNGNWWVILGCSGQQQYSNSVFDAVRSLSMAQEATVQGAGSMGEQFSNQIMAQIFIECEKFGFEILDDGIYHNDLKLGEVGQTDGSWWFTRATDEMQQRIPCDSALDAVWWLSMVDVVLQAEPSQEYLQYRPLEQLTTEELQQLLDAEVPDCEQLLDRPFDELTAEEWERLPKYEPHLELVAA
ncbi:hypothetical protein NIES4072_65750 [Nostoc commune NIES-4072]|uniref:Uncharacterized protein n=1 Tax=Nostoc commune NIES-4072 TaxID=2005467 RepID=A0A2R5G332_NOSCO|nr:hypothetical protein [Nostoc commune]BBD70209.1 hypothetical protein NIES4070_66200 [Nostoc commune HK-02]GBG22863.1 hypothetical protein NIES4072_65750 [Nostoc commune NIES-4072]